MRGKFIEHIGDCATCRAVMESYFAEMPQPHPLCEEGRAILKRMARDTQIPARVIPEVRTKDSGKGTIIL